MKKILATCTLFIVAIQFVNAQQRVNATGSVKDDKGNGVAYAFIRDWPSNYATYTDSVGDFKLTVIPNSSLLVKSTGYYDNTIAVTNNSDFKITLIPVVQSGGGSLQAQNNASKQNGNSSNQNFDFSGASFVKPKGDTQGSTYFFDNWLHGYFIKLSDSIAQNPAYLYNYDKITGSLVITQDKTSSLEVDAGQYKSFTLFDNSGNPYVFNKVPAIDNTHFAEVLSSGKKYSIYKTVKTYYKKADFSTNGVSSSGNNYDEYVDEFTYYVIKTGGQPQKLLLKTKSIKAVFSDDADMVNKFITDHSDDDINDAYLAKLGDYLNN
jgi:hypothetical protein